MCVAVTAVLLGLKEHTERDVTYSSARQTHYEGVQVPLSFTLGDAPLFLFLFTRTVCRGVAHLSCDAVSQPRRPYLV